MNLALVSPLPPQRSGIADYSAVLLRHLRSHFERITVVVDGYEPALEEGLVDSVVDLSDARAQWPDAASVPLYHIGCNTRYHGRLFGALRTVPGFTVLHDGNLLPMVHELTVAVGDKARFLREAAVERGLDGWIEGWRALRGGDSLRPDDYPMIGRVARESLGLVVHSECLARRVLAVIPGANVAVIPLLDMRDGDRASTDGPTGREALGLDATHVVVGAIGRIAPVKRLDVLFAAFSRVRGDFPSARILCVGQVAAGYRFTRLVRKFGLGDVVRATGYASPSMLSCYLRDIDVGVNLRSPTWGESSASLVRLMGCGVPTLVSDSGAFTELPDDAVVKIPGGSGGTDAVALALRDLLANAERRRSIGTAARAYVESRCDPRAVASAYADFIRCTLDQGVRQLDAGVTTMGGHV